MDHRSERKDPRVPAHESTRAPDSRPTQPGRVMIVDDEPVNCKLVRKYLANGGYGDFVIITESTEAMEAISRHRPDVILLDVMMPEVSGLDILAAVRADASLGATPVLILTASTDEEVRRRALELGATDFLNKPVSAGELIPRVRNTLLLKQHHDRLAEHAAELERRVRERTAALQLTQLETVYCLGRAAEFRDTDTGNHVIRVGKYAGILARELGLDAETVEMIEHAAPLHDVGKIGIPDHILLKPGALTTEERDLMRMHVSLGGEMLEPFSDDKRPAREVAHTELGARIIGTSSSPILQMASRIALTHHERWDGTGYPLGLAGNDIPIEGRITAVADVFDALSSRRPYKPPYPRAECFTIMAEGRGAHFDPQCIDAFFARKAEIVQVQIDYADELQCTKCTRERKTG